MYHFLRKTAVTFFIFAVAASLPVTGQSHNWNSHAEVAKKVKQKFENLSTYSADFSITTTEGGRVKNMRGKLYYKSPGKIRYDFSSPQGDLIVSDGKMLWIYISRLKAVGKQDLTLNTKNEDNNKIFIGTPGPGITRLFSKYHYRFDSVEQPRQIDGKSVFVLDMDQRVKIGGFEKIKLYIDSTSYLILKAVGSDNLSRQTEIIFSNQSENPEIAGKLFQYNPPENVRVVLNPLVGE